jgi:pseudouridine 5'-phosphatase
MGVPGSSTGEVFHEWAQLPIPRSQFAQEQKEQQRLLFPECEPLPGAERLLSSLHHAHNLMGKKIHIALASSSEKSNFLLKTQRRENKEMLSVFHEDRTILGDDPRVKHGRGKPAPDIYLLALRMINESLEEEEEEIKPNECVAFEDSVPGVEAVRRAGMRVVWVPHKELAKEYVGREEEVLAGRIGLVKIGIEEQLGKLGDGWGQVLESLEGFDYGQYGIEV